MQARCDGIWIRAIALTMKKKKVPATASRPSVAANWATRRRLHGEAEDGAEDEEDEDQLEAEHRPVAGPPHAPGHHPHEQRRREDLERAAAVRRSTSTPAR